MSESSALNRPVRPEQFWEFSFLPNDPGFPTAVIEFYDDTFARVEIILKLLADVSV